MDEEEAARGARLEHFKHALGHHSALSAALVSFMQTSLRTSFLLNGGAIVAALSLYGAKSDRFAGPLVSGAVAFWLIGLLGGAIATYFVMRAQRQFQAAAGNEFNRLAWDYFGIRLNVQDPAPIVDEGVRFRRRFYQYWGASIGAFALGALVALIALLSSGASSIGGNV